MKPVNPAPTTLTLREVVEAFVEYCRGNNVQLIKPPLMKQTLIDVINNHHGVRLRHDIINPTGKHTNGWKGLTLTGRLELGGGSNATPDKPDHPNHPLLEKSHSLASPECIRCVVE